MDDLMNAHALRYATTMTRRFVLKHSKLQFPHYFEFARLHTRPVTPREYYVPPTLQAQAFVITHTSFDKTDCERLSCFPFKGPWEPCTDMDGPRWISIGTRFVVACAPSCREHAVHTEWTGNACVVSNPLKLWFASMPETLLGHTSLAVHPEGIDVDRGTLKLNRSYCEAYGLAWADGDCVAPGGRTWSEWLFGALAHLPTKVPRHVPIAKVPPPLPAILNYVPSAPKRPRRYADDHSPELEQLFQEVASDLKKERGVAAEPVQRFLKTLIPPLDVDRFDPLAVKLVLAHVALTGMLFPGHPFPKHVSGKALRLPGDPTSLYEAGVRVLDAFRPFDRVLDRVTLQKIDAELDRVYFQGGPIRPLLTPDYASEHFLFLEDRASVFEFMIEKVEEYWTAFRTHPASQAELEKKVEQPIPGDEDVWIKTSLGLWVWMAVVLGCLTSQWIHVWASVVFFLKLYFNV